VVHHGGHFVQNGRLLYVGVFIDDWSCDPVVFPVVMHLLQ